VQVQEGNHRGRTGQRKFDSEFGQNQHRFQFATGLSGAHTVVSSSLMVELMGGFLRLLPVYPLADKFGLVGASNQSSASSAAESSKSCRQTWNRQSEGKRILNPDRHRLAPGAQM
jgi:hypothetical protein